MTSLTRGDAANRDGKGPVGKSRRRVPTPAEHKRRQAWGKEWGRIGHAWKQAHETKG